MPIHHMKECSYTLKMYLLDVGCSLKGFCSLNHSEVVSFIIFALTLSPTLSANFPKPRKSCDGGNGLSLHPYAHPPQDKILQHLIFVSDICVGCNLRGSTASTIALWHHLNIYIAHYFKQLSSQIRCSTFVSNRVTVHPHAHPPQKKVLKHSKFV